jgi:hypothetical protein
MDVFYFYCSSRIRFLFLFYIFLIAFSPSTITLHFPIFRVLGQITEISSQPQPERIHITSLLADCCSLPKSRKIDQKNADNLLSCVNKSANANSNRILREFKEGLSSRLSIGLVTYATEDIWDFTQYSFAINEAYAEHNGYSMLFVNPGQSLFCFFSTFF